MKYLTGLLLVLLVISSCGRPSIKHERKESASGIPVAIVVESEIKGEIFGIPLKNPGGLAIDSGGAVYVCDQGNNRVLKFSSDLKPLKEAGGFGSQVGLFDQPRFITSDGFRYILISDAGNHRIQKLNFNLVYSDVIILDDVDDPLKYGSLSGLAISSEGSLKVADPERNRLVSLNILGQFENFAADLGDRGGQLYDPGKVMIDRRDNIYICDAGNKRVAVYDKYMYFTREIVDPAMIRPVASVFPDEETLWILDQQLSAIFCFSIEGLMLSPQPIPIYGGEKSLLDPYDLLLLPDGRMLISDFGNNRIVVCKVISNQPANR